jgi:hypothetical protein
MKYAAQKSFAQYDFVAKFWSSVYKVLSRFYSQMDVLCIMPPIKVAIHMYIHRYIHTDILGIVSPFRRFVSDNLKVVKICYGSNTCTMFANSDKIGVFLENQCCNNIFVWNLAKLLVKNAKLFANFFH